MKVDKLSLRILKELRKNARESYAEIGRKVGLTPPAVAERIKKMEDLGIIHKQKTKKKEYEEARKEFEENNTEVVRLEEQPKFIKGGKMREYQVRRPRALMAAALERESIPSIVSAILVWTSHISLLVCLETS